MKLSDKNHDFERLYNKDKLYLIILYSIYAIYGTPFADIRNKANIRNELDLMRIFASE